jgi:hypothetical protein
MIVASVVEMEMKELVSLKCLRWIRWVMVVS